MLKKAAMLKKDETIVEIGKGLRQRDEDITHAPLPRRWIDLIRHLNEQERRELETRARPLAELNAEYWGAVRRE
jgi:hypothetical protein